MTSAIEELEKLACDWEESMDWIQYSMAPRLLAIATSLRAEVREGKREAFVEGWSEHHDTVYPTAMGDIERADAKSRADRRNP